jgi:glucose-6-phosphate 1-dehydrogenase
MVIFGATGDLTHRKLLPALYNLALEHPLPAGFSVVGFARRPYDDEFFRKQALGKALPPASITCNQALTILPVMKNYNPC